MERLFIEVRTLTWNDFVKQYSPPQRLTITEIKASKKSLILTAVSETGLHVKRTCPLEALAFIKGGAPSYLTWLPEGVAIEQGEDVADNHYLEKSPGNFYLSSVPF